MGALNDCRRQPLASPATFVLFLLFWPPVGGQDPFAEADTVGSDLDELVVVDELDRLGLSQTGLHPEPHARLVGPHRPTPPRGARTCAPRPRRGLRALLLFLRPPVGGQDPFAEADTVGSDLDELVVVDELDRLRLSQTGLRPEPHARLVGPHRPTPPRGARTCAPRPRRGLRALLLFLRPPVGGQDPFAEADTVGSDLDELVVVDELDRLF